MSGDRKRAGRETVAVVLLGVAFFLICVACALISAWPDLT
jgi:hypothetical protein